MFGKILDTLISKKTLLDDARQEAVMMLVSDRRMFELVLMALKEDSDHHIRARIADMDKDINLQQRDVRKKVFAHLSISRGQDLQGSLELIMAVIDLERIGDYTKNMSELLEMLPGKTDYGPHGDDLQEAMRLSYSLFDLCVSSFARNDRDSAKKAMENYNRLSRLCNQTLEQLFEETKGQDNIRRDYMGLILLLRYLKRVGAHLKNIASAEVNPFHRIGYTKKF